jgi:hypothetical protein
MPIAFDVFPVLASRFQILPYIQKTKTNITMKGWKVLNLLRTDKYSESSTELAAHTQILKQQKQLNGRNHHIPININTEC